MRKKANPKPTIDDICVINGSPYAETHEIIPGNSVARICQDEGLIIRLSGEMHRSSPTGIHHNDEFKRVVQMVAEQQWIDRENATTEDFRQRFHCKSFIGEFYEEYKDSNWWDKLMEYSIGDKPIK